MGAGGGRGTASEHYKRFAKLGVPGYVLDEDKTIDDVPDDMAHLITWYTDIRNRTPRGQMFEPISFSDLEHFRNRLIRLGLEMDELEYDLLCRLDAIWQEAVPKPDSTINRPKPKPTRQPLGHGPGQPTT